MAPVAGLVSVPVNNLQKDVEIPSRLLGMTQLEFQALLASHDLYIHYDVEDLHEDVRNLQELGFL